MSTLESVNLELRGSVVTPGHPDYEAARRVYNAMIDRRPAIIARCADVADVVRALAHARAEGLQVAVRGGGHNGAGLGVCDDGLVIDLSMMNGVRVDPDEGTVRVEGGATLGKVDHATHAFGLAVPSGVISTTGVGGLTLGGGLGHLTRKYGLSIDNLLEADVVLADGTVVTASADRHPDLFWALRGGGGNFGIVTSFLFQGRPVKTIVGGPTLYPIERAADVLRWYREFIPNAPEDLSGFFAFLTVPPGPPFPPELHMKKVCGVVWCYSGPRDKADAAFAPVRAFGPPALYGVHEMPFTMLQTAFDALMPPGLQWYWRADFVNEISDAAVARHVEFGPQMPTMLSTMHLYPIDGAVHRVGEAETAFSYRNSGWAGVIVGVDPDPANAGLIKDWAVRYWEALHPYSAGGAYVNFMMDEGPDRVQATFRGNYARLSQAKRKYDPDNVFRVNQNIRPAPPDTDRTA